MFLSIYIIHKINYLSRVYNIPNRSIITDIEIVMATNHEPKGEEIPNLKILRVC